TILNFNNSYQILKKIKFFGQLSPTLPKSAPAAGTLISPSPSLSRREPAQNHHLKFSTTKPGEARQQQLPLSPTSKTKAPHNNLNLICSFGSREGIVFPTRPDQMQILQILKSQKQKRFPLCGLWFLQVVNLNQQEPERSLIQR
ncbi:hypothetical protein NC653_015920, partial [Populus alba x Populus x berolinensis]